MFQDVLENDEIKLDWMFRYSIMQDIVRVSLAPSSMSKQYFQYFCLHFIFFSLNTWFLVYVYFLWP